MGLFLRQEDTRSELQSKIATELREKLQNQQNVDNKKPDPAFLENQHQTRPAGMILMILGFILVVTLVVFVLRMSGIV